MTDLRADQRRTPRVPGADKQTFVLPLTQTVQLLDISMSGALLSSPQRVGVGRRTALRTTLGGEPFGVEIQVQRVSPAVKDANVHEPTRFQLGVTFVSLDERSLRCIQRFLNQKPA